MSLGHPGFKTGSEEIREGDADTDDGMRGALGTATVLSSGPAADPRACRRASYPTDRETAWETGRETGRESSRRSGRCTEWL
ncbi:hypothetical protein GCM10010252_64240 [Streptomyces aureoverticillatus]|nr:hypothetical protein GCM10010252_64240 [Streptomyces aureoverticillatus]